MKRIFLLMIYTFLFSISLIACETAKDINLFNTKKEKPKPCPVIKILKDAKKITSFKNNEAKDISGIIFEAEIIGYSGKCEYKKRDKLETEIVIELEVLLDLFRGPANNTNSANLGFFIAIPSFFPNPEGKKVFYKSITFPKNLGKIRMIDRDIIIRIPITNRNVDSIPIIFLGLKLTKNQLDYNRKTNSQLQLKM